MSENIVLITGATSGIGAAFAKKYASLGYNLIITGRREEKIRAFAYELMNKHSIQVEVIIAELSNDNDLENLTNKVRNTDLSVLINNAGFGLKNNFHEEQPLAIERMVKVHSLAPVKLTHAALLNMVPKKKGAIINVSSIAGFCPYPKNSVYAATKAFVNLFSKSVALELNDIGVKIQAICPGFTVTDFHEKMGFNPSDYYSKRGLFKAMRPEEVVEYSFKALAKNKVICIPGFRNKLIKAICTLMGLFF